MWSRDAGHQEVAAAVRRGGLVLAGLLALTASSGSPAAGQRPRPKPEVRTDLIAGSVSAVHLGAAWNLYSGPYLRTALVAGAGPSRHRGEVRGSGRIEALARFHLDPLRESRAGLYGSGGVGLMYDPFDRWRPRLIALIGVELPTRGSRAWALEAGLGGGLRLGAALRWTGSTRP